MKKKVCAVVVRLVYLSMAACVLNLPLMANVFADETVDAAGHGYTTLDERHSYAYGVHVAKIFKGQGLELDVSIVEKAMRTVFEDGDILMSDDEVVATIEAFRAKHQEAVAEKRAARGVLNKKISEVFLGENAKKDGVVVLESGLQYKVINKGTGDFKPRYNDYVFIHYRGTFVDGTEFDSSYKKNEPWDVRVGSLMPGWVEALQMMTEGAVWELYIPAELAYGEEGVDDFIGPNQALIFRVELLKIEKNEPPIPDDEDVE
ncbi:FKBP-type peptidyl-prolyl cis-trans isomerase [Aurantivibrio plasticivorans]